ncbi:hypothetical protein GCM10025789_22100 [Tessaracoccus lubricantis]|uniref:Uncharacterized protein n=1 Tax=Tessaracoccus lubricantis TaxID=545543 RepID=A0ABP9FKF9_9ACTN
MVPTLKPATDTFVNTTYYCDMEWIQVAIRKHERVGALLGCQGRGLSASQWRGDAPRCRVNTREKDEALT